MTENLNPVKSIEEYRLLIKNKLSHSDVVLSFDQMVQVDILRQLIALNQRLGFAIAIIIVGFALILIFGK